MRGRCDRKRLHREKKTTYLVRWAGYDSTYQTWEKADDIAPALLKAFHARIACPVRLEQPMHEMREAVAQVLMKMRRPMASVEVTVHIAALAPLAHALLACASRPPSTRGGPALEIERDVGPDVTTTSVQLDEPEDVGHMLQLQVVRARADTAAPSSRRAAAATPTSPSSALPSCCRTWSRPRALMASTCRARSSP